MTCIRRGLILLMLTALLPWGAYSAHFAFAGTEKVFASSFAAGDAVLTPAKRKCRIAVLPGSPCGPDLAEQQYMMPSRVPVLARAAFGRDLKIAAGQIESPPTGPPRPS